MVYACVYNVTPPYISNLLTSYVPSTEMRSTGQLILHQPISDMVTYSERSSPCGGPRLWNNLDPHLRKIVSPQLFKRKLKTHLYKNFINMLNIVFLASLVEGKYVSHHS